MEKSLGQRNLWCIETVLVGGDWNMNFMNFHILGIIIPFDFHISQRGRSTTNQKLLVLDGERSCFKESDMEYQFHISDLFRV